MRELLASRGIQLSKSLGQNFLHDGNQLRRIIAAAELTGDDRVLEIGPGLGPLTELLLENAGEVLAIEKDARLVEFLRERFNVGQASSLSPSKNENSETVATSVLRLLHDDALAFLKREQRDWSGWKLVANLPYSVASPILVELASGARAPKKIVATLQLEVAQRLMARPGDKNYGVLTLLVQLDYEPREHFKIPAGCFFPAPDVDSACVVLDRRATPLLPENQREGFVKIVKRAFSQRRKMMLKLLREDWPAEKLEWAFAGLKISLQERAEKLSVEQFTGLTWMLTNEIEPQKRGGAEKKVKLCVFAPLRWIMSEEIFDVVNERDEVIDWKPRSEVHRLGLLHRAIHVLVFNSRGEIFLQKRSMTKDREPGKWDSSSSGHVDSGEDYDACAVRELREEIGLIVPKTPERLFKIDACAETDQEFVRVYRCQAEGPFRLHPEEIECGEWFAPEAVTRWMAGKTGGFCQCLPVDLVEAEIPSFLLVLVLVIENLSSTMTRGRTRTIFSQSARGLLLYLREKWSSSLAMQNFLVPIVVEQTGRGERTWDIYSRLLVDRIIFLGTQVDDTVSNIIIAQLLFLQMSDAKKDIHLYINSPGGSVTAGLAIYDTMQFLTCDVNTYCIGQAASMGAVLLAAGTKGKRYALPNARILIHQPWGGVQGQASDISIQAREILRLKDRLNEILGKHCGRKVDELARDTDRDRFMSADEAKEYGLVDHVVQSRKEIPGAMEKTSVVA